MSIVQQGAAYFESGSGTSSDPYLIKTAQQLQYMNYAEGYYALVSDIDLSSFLSNSVTGWTPIGTKEKPFYGTFDGRNHTISGIWTNQPTSDNMGLFGYIGGGSTIKDLALITNTNGIIGNTCVGGICGYLYGEANVNNCVVDGTISGKDYVGGVCGGAEGVAYYGVSKGKISNCISKGIIKSSGSNRGEIIGGNLNSNCPCTVTNCSSTAKLQDN